MKASWEGIAHVLEHEDVSDVELAARLGCDRDFVARVRADLKRPTFPAPMALPLPPKPSPDLDRFLELSVVVGDGHREWRGRRTEDGTPLFNARVTAGRVAFRLHHDREPEGHVRVECEHPHCVEGLHLSDRPMRERAREAM